jgi:hypothetical protein
MRFWILAFVAAVGLFSATPAALAIQGKITTDLPLRAAPSNNSELLLTMPAGSTVSVARCSGRWCRITWKGYTGYTLKSGLVIAAATPTRGPVRGGVTTADGSDLWPILPPYPYRAGYYPKADWYHDIPPYVSIEPSFYRRRYFMILQEHNRYRYVPYVFRGNHYKDSGSIGYVDMQKIDTTLKQDESGSTYTAPNTPNPPAATLPAPATPNLTTPAPGTNGNTGE